MTHIFHIMVLRATFYKQHCHWGHFKLRLQSLLDVPNSLDELIKSPDFRLPQQIYIFLFLPLNWRDPPLVYVFSPK